MDTLTGYDCFVLYALEDKLNFVRPLITVLSDCGLACWYDEDKLIVGDSLSESIACGMTQSRTGLLIFSRCFIEKPWSIYERNGLKPHHSNEEIRLIPILHGITHGELQKASPSLANLVCVDTSKLKTDEMVEKIVHAARPDAAVDENKKELYGHINVLVEQRLAFVLEQIVEKRSASIMEREERRVQAIEKMYQQDLKEAREIQRSLTEECAHMSLSRQLEDKF